MTEQIDAVQRMQDYIEAHLPEEITMSALAKTAMFSPWYARRIFIRIIGAIATKSAVTSGESLRASNR